MKIPFFKKKEKKKLSRTISGSRHKTIFHGGCIGCENDDLSICRGCCYFEADWTLPELNTDRVHVKKLFRKSEELFNKQVGLHLKFDRINVNNLKKEREEMFKSIW